MTKDGGPITMPELEETLPLQRTFVERHVGQLVGIFQIDRNELKDRSEATSLATGDMVGLVAVADGGKLSETAFNVFTVASQWFAEAGCPESNRLDFTLGAFARRLWGEHGRSVSKRKRLVAAINELMRTQVVVLNIDPYTLESKVGSQWEMNLLESFGANGEWQAVFEAAGQGDAEAIRKFASLASRAAGSDDRSTWGIVLPGWLGNNIRRGHGVILDYDVQRMLRGSAKRIWVQLETHTAWTDHELRATDDPNDLLDQLPADGELYTQTVLPSESEPTSTVQTLVVPLDNETYEAFGLRHANRKRDLHAACLSILATDPTYLRAEIRAAPRSKRRFELHLVRATGALRQQQLRKRLRQTREAPAAAA